jgi:hypothetical protein
VNFDSLNQSADRSRVIVALAALTQANFNQVANRLGGDWLCARRFDDMMLRGVLLDELVVPWRCDPETVADLSHQIVLEVPTLQHQRSLPYRLDAL